MKITSYEATTLRIPEDDPLANMPEEAGRTRPVVILRLRTDSGIEGIGLTFYGGKMTGSLRVAVEELAALTIGEDPLRIEKIIAKLRDGTGDSCGPGGIFMLALSAIDIALWDIKGKALDQPLWKLLGGHRDRVATYASGSLRRGLTDDQAQRAAQILVQKGFTEMKTQMALPGNPTPAEEIRRVRVVREAIGPDIKLMCDINQRWRPEQAIDIGSRIEDVGLFWLEDVTTADDYQGLARVTAALKTPGCRWRVRLGHRAVPPHDRGPVGRHRHDRHRARRRRDAMDEDRRHGRGFQSARRQSCHAGDAGASRRRLPEWADGGIHALDAGPV